MSELEVVAEFVNASTEMTEGVTRTSTNRRESCNHDVVQKRQKICETFKAHEVTCGSGKTEAGLQKQKQNFVLRWRNIKSRKKGSYHAAKTFLEP